MSRPGSIPSPSGSPRTARNSNSSNSSSSLPGQEIAGQLTEQRHPDLSANSSAAYANRQQARDDVTKNFPQGSSPTASPRSINPLVARLAVAATAKATSDFAQTALAAGQRSTARQAVGLQALSAPGGPRVVLLASSGEAGLGARDYLEYNQFAIESNPGKFLFVLDNLPVDFNESNLAQQKGQLPKFLLDRQELVRGLDTSTETHVLNRLTVLEDSGKPLLDGEKNKRPAWAQDVKAFLMSIMNQEMITEDNQAFPEAQLALDRIAKFLANPSSKAFDKLLNQVRRFASAYSISIKKQASKRDDSQRLEAWSKRLADLAKMNPGKTIVCISSISNVLSSTMYFDPETETVGEDDDEDNAPVKIDPQTMAPVVRSPEHKTGLATILTRELTERGLGTALPVAFGAGSVKSFSFDSSVVKTDFSKGNTDACLTVPSELFASKNWGALNEARAFARDLQSELPQPVNSAGAAVPPLKAKKYLDTLHAILVKADDAAKKAAAPALMELMQKLDESRSTYAADIWKPLLSLIYAMD